MGNDPTQIPRDPKINEHLIFEECFEYCRMTSRMTFAWHSHDIRMTFAWHRLTPQRCRPPVPHTRKWKLTPKIYTKSSFLSHFRNGVDMISKVVLEMGLTVPPPFQKSFLKPPPQHHHQLAPRDQRRARTDHFCNKKCIKSTPALSRPENDQNRPLVI